MLSQRHFLKVEFPRDNFPSGNFPKVRLGSLRHHRLQWGPCAAARMARVPNAAARTDMGSYRLGNWTFEKLPLWKIPLGNNHLGKYPWEVTTLENTLGK